MELRWRLEIYDNEETRTRNFATFLEVGHQDFPAEVQSYDIWTTIANELYDMGLSQDLLVYSSFSPSSHYFRFQSQTMGRQGR